MAPLVLGIRGASVTKPVVRTLSGQGLDFATTHPLLMEENRAGVIAYNCRNVKISHVQVSGK